MENRSLNEFLNDESRATDTETQNTAVTAARPTMVWTPDGAVCADCGETVQRRWRETTDDTERLVCRACKPWE